uniref:RRM domain-containing protein n=1 Tax=Saimiri boliviensis boliviensis TaxID=39432 RepID=A0A2K6V0W2_SAIBB
MAPDDFDTVIEAMLEAPYKKEEDENTTRSTSNSGNGTSGSSTIREIRLKKGSRSHSRSRDRKHSHGLDWDQHRQRDSQSRSRDGQHRHRSRGSCALQEPPLATGHGCGHSKSPHFGERSPATEPADDPSPEELDARTVFCMQLAAHIRPPDLEDVFSAVDKVRDVRGIAYVAFCEIQSVPLAIGLTGQRLLGAPFTVQASQAKKKRLAAMANNLQKGTGGPVRLHVGSLHFNVTEDMLRGIFEPFGKIDNIVPMKVSDTGCSKGYGFIMFSDSECAWRALEQLSGFELAGRPMRVGHVTERLDGGTDITFPDGDQDLDLGSAGGCLQLVAKWAAASQLHGAVPLGALNPAALTALSPALNLASQCC